MPLFAYEIEFRRRQVAIQTGLFQRRIEHFVSSVLNRGAVRGDLQSKKLPAVGVWKGCAIVLYHGLCRDQLQNGTRRIFLIGHTVLKYSDGFPELFGIGILNPRVSYFRQVEEAAEALFVYRKIISRKGYGQIETQNESDNGAHYFSLIYPETAFCEPNLGKSLHVNSRKSHYPGHLANHFFSRSPSSTSQFPLHHALHPRVIRKL
jgi:hypothetical protein